MESSNNTNNKHKVASNGNSSNLIDINANSFKPQNSNYSNYQNNHTAEKKSFTPHGNGNSDNQPKKNYIDFQSKSKNKLEIKKSYNINEITNQSDNHLLKVKINPNFQNEFAVINSNFAVNYLEISNDGAFSIGSFSEHTDRINDLAFFESENSVFQKSFVSCGNDGCIKIWDSRSPNSAKTFKTNGIHVYCVDVIEDRVVAGFGREIGVWDLKTMKNICRYKNGHCEDVICLKLKNKTNLLSAGEDGIINHFDIQNGLNMNAVVTSLNLGQPPLFVDFLDESMNLVQAITTVNTLEICSLEKGQSQFSYNAVDDAYNNQYCLDAFLVQNNLGLNSDKSVLSSANENLYNGNNYLQMFCGNHYGDIVTLDFLLNETMDVKVNSIIKTEVAQTFNSISKAKSNKSGFTHSIAVSDLGNIYILDKKADSGNDLNAVEIPDFDDKEEEVETNTNNKASKYSATKFNPY